MRMAASVGVEHNLCSESLRQGDRHSQRILDEIGAHLFIDRPPSDPSEVPVADDR